jgi:4-hydroxybenzoate polyprenyltransferase
MGSPFSGYARLYRLSIAFTPVADVLAGHAVSTPAGEELVLDARVFAACAASSLAFCFGVSLNDFVDRRKDRESAPSRPLPSGRIAPGAALCASLLPALLSLALAFWVGPRTGLAMMAVLLLAVLYNLLTRRSDLAGVINLGAIRAADLFVGTTLLSSGPIFSWSLRAPGTALLIYGFYGCALSVVALGERAQKDLDIRWPAGAAAGVAALPAVLCAFSGYAAPGTILWLIVALPIYRHFSLRSEPVEKLVGHLVSGFFLLAALFALSGGRLGMCIFLWIAYFLSRMLSRWFPPS